jgi:uncharacterized protein YlbG (UPF0298 family)
MKKIDILNEVYTEKQRKWACSQMNAPKSEREISKLKATEMCKDVKHSKKKKKETVNPKMKKKDLVEYINKRVALKEDRDEVFYVSEIPSPEKREIFIFFEQLRQSGVINMFGSSPILNWTKEDLHRWLYGMKKDIESIESEIEDLEYDNEEGENDSEIELLESQKENINYLLENKNKIRDILVRAAMTRIENSNGNLELSNVQRVFEKIAGECFKMWVSLLNQRN